MDWFLYDRDLRHERVKTFLGLTEYDRLPVLIKMVFLIMGD